LFDPFEQVGTATRRAINGTGLGLAISQRLVAMMGGAIQVTSCPGEGSTFSFEVVLPRAVGTSCAPALFPVANAASNFHNVAVLVAEDHLLSQEILLEMLEDIGCVVDVAGDGAEAVACAEENRYDLILLDVRMPKMDGFQAARAIRALPEHRQTPIIALTANAFAEDRRRCFDAGMNGHVGKPVTPAILIAALGQWLPGAISTEEEGGESELRRTLANIHGLDVGNRRSPDQLENYCVLLNRFAQLHGRDMARLRECLSIGDSEAAQHISHQLIGIAGLIGAGPVAALAKQIEEGLRAGHDQSRVIDLAALCETELASLSAAIATLRLPEEVTY
jgi:CheY-like chemotaxis protein/HPt (histidine-containing phosphotransfer) domain-containing protein